MSEIILCFVVLIAIPSIILSVLLGIQAYRLERDCKDE